MLIYCLKSKENTKNIDSKMLETKNGRLMLPSKYAKVTMTNKVIRAKSKCATCMDKKSRFLKQKHNKKSG